MSEEISKENNDDEEEDVDIYANLPNFQFDVTLDNLQKKNSNLEKKIKLMEKRVQTLTKALSLCMKERDQVSKNMSCLYLSAKHEINRKDKMITELRSRNLEYAKRISGRNVDDVKPVEPTKPSDTPKETTLSKASCPVSTKSVNQSLPGYSGIPVRTSNTDMLKKIPSTNTGSNSATDKSSAVGKSVSKCPPVLPPLKGPHTQYSIRKYKQFFGKSPIKNRFSRSIRSHRSVLLPTSFTNRLRASETKEKRSSEQKRSTVSSKMVNSLRFNNRKPLNRPESSQNLDNRKKNVEKSFPLRKKQISSDLGIPGSEVSAKNSPEDSSVLPSKDTFDKGSSVKAVTPETTQHESLVEYGSTNLEQNAVKDTAGRSEEIKENSTVLDTPVDVTSKEEIMKESCTVSGTPVEDKAPREEIIKETSVVFEAPVVDVTPREEMVKENVENVVESAESSLKEPEQDNSIKEDIKNTIELAKRVKENIVDLFGKTSEKVEDQPSSNTPTVNLELLNKTDKSENPVVEVTLNPKKIDESDPKEEEVKTSFGEKVQNLESFVKRITRQRSNVSYLKKGDKIEGSEFKERNTMEETKESDLKAEDMSDRSPPFINKIKSHTRVSRVSRVIIASTSEEKVKDTNPENIGNDTEGNTEPDLKGKKPVVNKSKLLINKIKSCAKVSRLETKDEVKATKGSTPVKRIKPTRLNKSTKVLTTKGVERNISTKNHENLQNCPENTNILDKILDEMRIPTLPEIKEPPKTFKPTIFGSGVKQEIKKDSIRSGLFRANTNSCLTSASEDTVDIIRRNVQVVATLSPIKTPRKRLKIDSNRTEESETDGKQSEVEKISPKVSSLNDSVTSCSSVKDKVSISLICEQGDFSRSNRKPIILFTSLKSTEVSKKESDTPLKRKAEDCVLFGNQVVKQRKLIMTKTPSKVNDQDYLREKSSSSSRSEEANRRHESNRRSDSEKYYSSRDRHNYGPVGRDRKLYRECRRRDVFSSRTCTRSRRR